MSSDGLDALHSSSVWLGDGTFKVVTESIDQLYTIHAGKRTYPVAAFALMDRRSKDAYNALFSKLKEVIFFTNKDIRVKV